MKNRSKYNVAAYIRLSREDGDKEESDSVGNQKKLLTEYVSEQEELVLYDMYIDDGYTGTSFHRPAFQRMLTDIESKKVNCVVVKDLSRFGRDYIETGRYLERLFPELDVRFISISDHIDSVKKSYDMLLPIRNIFNEQYARDVSEKVQTALRTKQKAGEFIGAFPSYGYKKSTADKNKLVIDEYAASVVRRIFSLYIQGYGKQKIAAILNEEGILCPSEYKRMKGENYRNNNRMENAAYWTYSTINSILRKEIYVGNMVQGTKHQCMRSRQRKMPQEEWIIVRNTHEAVIDQETWEKTQALLKKRTRVMNTEKNRNIFAGFIKCGDCGRAMTKNVWRHADGSRICTFYCGTYRRNGKGYCTPHAIPAEVLERIILDDLNTIIRILDKRGKPAAFQSLTSSDSRRPAGREMERIKTELLRVKYYKKKLYEDYRDTIISKEEFCSYRQDYLKQEDLYLKQMKAMEDKKREDTAELLWVERLLELKEIEALEREMVVEMISEIQIYEDHRIKIIYNFENKPEYDFSPRYVTELQKNI